MTSVKDLVKMIRDTTPEGCFQNDSEPTGFLSTGWLPLDEAMGGGIAMPKLTVVSGKTHAGKTLIACNAVRSLQRRGGLAIYGNFEIAPIVHRAAQLGINTEEWVLIDGQTLDSYYAGNKREENLRLGYFDRVREVVDKVRAVDDALPILTVLDSVTMARTSMHVNKKPGVATVGAHARVMSDELMSFHQYMHENNVSALFINHITHKIGVMYGKDTTFRAEAQQSGYAVATIELDRGKRLDNGQMVHVTITKNKVTGDRTRALNFPAYYVGGVPYLEGCVEYMAEHGSRKGYIDLDGRTVGKNAALKAAQEDEEVAALVCDRAEALLQDRLNELRKCDFSIFDDEPAVVGDCADYACGEVGILEV